MHISVNNNTITLREKSSFVLGYQSTPSNKLNYDTPNLSYTFLMQSYRHHKVLPCKVISTVKLFFSWPTII